MAVSEDPEIQEPWFDAGYLDDQLWHQALATFHGLESMRGGDFPIDDLVLFHLIRRGVVDHDDMDKRWDSSTRSMRHSLAIGSHLWSLIRKEVDRVSLSV